MNRKIDVFINGKYQFTTTHYKTIKELITHIRAVKHIEIASVPNRYITVYDYDTVYAKYVG